MEPGGHSVPTAHVAQLTDPADEANVPAGHLVASVHAGEQLQNQPAGHGSQVALLLARVALLKVPFGQ
jgi:hypothetical protein